MSATAPPVRLSTIPSPTYSAPAVRSRAPVLFDWEGSTDPVFQRWLESDYDFTKYGPVESAKISARIERLRATEEIPAAVINAWLDKPAKKASQSLTIPFGWATEIDEDQLAVKELVEGVLTVGSLALIYGESNSGKTYLAVSLACSVALDQPWLGKRIGEPGAVIYIAGEGALSVEMRLAAFKKHFGVMPENFGIVKTALNLMDPSGDVEQLLELIAAKQNEIGVPIVLVVVDTVARAMPGGSENDAQDMGRLVRGADRIKEQTGAAVLLIHHAGKDSTKGARGSSALRAAVDTEIEVTESDGVHIATITKQRDLDTRGQSVAARFLPVPLGKNQWGEIRSACVVEREDVPVVTREPGGKAQKAVMAILKRDGPTSRGQLRSILVADGFNRTHVYPTITKLLELELINDGPGGLYVVGSST